MPNKEKKICTKCNIEKPIEGFHLGNARCKECTNEYRRTYYQNNKEKGKRQRKKYYAKNAEKIKEHAREYSQRPEVKQRRKKYVQDNREKINKNNREKYNKIGYELLAKYGIDAEDKNRMIAEQHGRCFICNNKFKSSGDTHVDHCHCTKQIRAILCGNCNRMLGCGQDNENILISGAEYLMEWKTAHAYEKGRGYND